MLLNCKQVAELVSENIDKPLSGTPWLKMKVHLFLCAYCRRYNKQMALSCKTVGCIDKKTQPSDQLCKNAEHHFREIHKKHE